MPYIVVRGEVHDGDRRYRLGQFVPGHKGTLADMEAVGAVEWVEAAAREASKPPAKRKALK
jgi:hypothetical protein